MYTVPVQDIDPTRTADDRAVTVRPHAFKPKSASIIELGNVEATVAHEPPNVFRSHEPTIEVRHRNLGIGQVEDLRLILRLAKSVAEQKAEEFAKTKEEVEAERERVRKEREEERERRAKLIEERKERCLMELADEEVKVRAKGYKSTVKAVVRVRELTRWEGMERVGTGEYVPYIEYHNEADVDRPSSIEKIRRLVLKEGARYTNVIWDDGQGDLSPWDRSPERGRME